MEELKRALGWVVLLLGLVGWPAAPGEAADGCTVAMIPDTQFYYARPECGNCTSANCAAWPGPYSCNSDADCAAFGGQCVGPSNVPGQMTQYLLDHRLDWDPGYPIAFASQAGDVVDLYWQQERWLAMEAALHRLDGVIPWAVAAGNHDGNQDLGALEFPVFLQYFNGTVYGGITPPPGSQWIENWGDWPVNAAHRLTCGSREVLHLAIQWDADLPQYAEVLERAREILEEHADLPAILTVHAYLDRPGTSGATQGYTELYEAGGLHLWENLVKVSPNLFLVLSAHRIHTTTEPAAHVRARPRKTGSDVVETLFNAQIVGSDPDKGEGWINFLRIDWEQDTIRYRAYSPMRDQTAREAGFDPLHTDGTVALAAPDACANGLDDDGDGLVDLADPGCAHAGDLAETTIHRACDDGLDNDGDGGVDARLTGGAPGCVHPAGASESPMRCGLGFEAVAPLGVVAALRRRRRARR